MQEALSPRLVQLSHGFPRLHLSFLCLQGAHERGTLFLFRTTRNWPSGDWPEWDELAEGGVGVMVNDNRNGGNGVPSFQSPNATKMWVWVTVG